MFCLESIVNTSYSTSIDITTVQSKKGKKNVHMKDAWRGVGLLTPFIGFSNIIS